MDSSPAMMMERGPGGGSWQLSPSSPTRCAHYRHRAREIYWNPRFADVFTQTQDGRLAIDYRRFRDTAALGAAPA
jgi:hypothetical protein